MSPPNYHLGDELLMAYAAGSTNEAQSLLVASHITFCSECRARVQEFESLGGSILMEEPGEALDQGVLAKTLAALDTSSAETPSVEAIRTDELPPGAQWPRPLHPYLKGRRWQRVLPGVSRIDLDLCWDGEPLRLFSLKPKFKVPKHTHGGDEYQLVLRGGFTDLGEHYLPGDVAVRD
ncbi:MAG: ChrR family anti-sigma-E factor, partial [Myxococcota bacterium]